MKNTKKLFGALLVSALVAFSSVAAFGQEISEDVPSREDLTVVTIVAEVVGVDLENRELALLTEDGDELTFEVDPNVERLDEVEVGDILQIDYLQSVLFQLRAPTQDELDNPLQITDGAEVNGEDEAPGGGVVESVKAVCTIEVLDRPNMTVTLMGPLGGLNVVAVNDVNNLPLLSIGQSVVVTFTQALAVSLTKVGDDD